MWLASSEEDLGGVGKDSFMVREPEGTAYIYDEATA